MCLMKKKNSLFGSSFWKNVRDYILKEDSSKDDKNSYGDRALGIFSIWEG